MWGALKKALSSRQIVGTGKRLRIWKLQVLNI
jgi:hypothetical protein